ncbi:putative Nucleolar protein 56 [Paratrimastix pyriformis]|uniref:Nucleolar protein 56 n=1 Tax=Paratrimastix pyriformis TaxID=342808 RepID=A0ABQ8UBD6_9EUKA|nr:putative Nucleolar protein 56 [Paratrimastix pyriformis]
MHFCLSTPNRDTAAAERPLMLDLVWLVQGHLEAVCLPASSGSDLDLALTCLGRVIAWCVRARPPWFRDLSEVILRWAEYCFAARNPGMEPLRKKAKASLNRQPFRLVQLPLPASFSGWAAALCEFFGLAFDPRISITFICQGHECVLEEGQLNDAVEEPLLFLNVTAGTERLEPAPATSAAFTTATATTISMDTVVASVAAQALEVVQAKAEKMIASRSILNVPTQTEIRRRVERLVSQAMKNATDEKKLMQPSQAILDLFRMTAGSRAEVNDTSNSPLSFLGKTKPDFCVVAHPGGPPSLANLLVPVELKTELSWGDALPEAIGYGARLLDSHRLRQSVFVIAMGPNRLQLALLERHEQEITVTRTAPLALLFPRVRGMAKEELNEEALALLCQLFSMSDGEFGLPLVLGNCVPLKTLAKTNATIQLVRRNDDGAELVLKVCVPAANVSVPAKFGYLANREIQVYQTIGPLNLPGFLKMEAFQALPDGSTLLFLSPRLDPVRTWTRGLHFGLDLACGAVERLRALHQAGFLACDVRPSNWLMRRPTLVGRLASGGGGGPEIFLIDFGLALRIHERGRSANVRVQGDVRYASLAVLRDARRQNPPRHHYTAADDLQALVHVLTSASASAMALVPPFFEEAECDERLDQEFQPSGEKVFGGGEESQSQPSGEEVSGEGGEESGESQSQPSGEEPSEPLPVFLASIQATAPPPPPPRLSWRSPGAHPKVGQPHPCAARVPTAFLTPPNVPILSHPALPLGWRPFPMHHPNRSPVPDLSSPAIPPPDAHIHHSRPWKEKLAVKEGLVRVTGVKGLNSRNLMKTYLLFESAFGIALFEANTDGAVVQDEKNILEMARFGKMVKLTAFSPFKMPENALAQINDLANGILGEDMINFLRTNLPKPSKGEATFQVGCGDPKLGAAVQETLGVPCVCDETTQELFRGIRFHLPNFFPQLALTDMEKAQLALAHAYSRTKVKFDVNSMDNMVKQAVFLFDQLDKDINKMSMRAKEWYGGHFPELARMVDDNITYAKLICFIKNRSSLTDESLAGLEEITKDGAKALEILQTARISMGFDLSEMDMQHVVQFAQRVVDMSAYREKLRTYLTTKMNTVAPNLSALVGVLVGARLVSHAGSLTNLSKFPASTVQILGAEKALFRALKTKSNTPKYGLIFHSSFVGKAAAKNKGRISRYLANKCAMCSRIDSFGENPTQVYGEMMHEQVEERLRFYEEGVTPRKNLVVMREAAKKIAEAALAAAAEAPAADAAATPKKEHKKKRRATASTDEVLAAAASEAPATPAAEEAAPAPAEGEKKKKKKKARVEAEPVAE